MNRSLNIKLVLIFIVFIICVMTTVGIILLNSIYSFYTNDFVDQMERGFSERVTQQLSSDLESENFASAQKELLSAYSSSFSFDQYRNFYILDMDGKVLESSADDTGELKKTQNLLSAMNGKPGTKQVIGSEYLDYALYLENGENSCIIYIIDNLTRMKNLIWVLFSIIIQTLLIGLLIAVILSFFLAKAITAPIQDLTKGTMLIESGEYSYRIDSKSNDEIGILTNNFNSMAQTIENTLKQMSDEKEKFRTIFSCLEDGVAAFDENGRIIHINMSAKKMIARKEEITPEQEDNLTFNQLAGIIGHPEVTQELLGTTNYVSISEVNLCSEPNKELIADISFAIFTYEGDKRGYIVVIQDITGRALLDKSRCEFVANESHELRTPLTSIKGATEIIASDDDMPDNMKERFLSIIMNETDRMTRIVKDLLVLSRLDNRRMSWKVSSFSIQNAVSQMCMALQAQANEHNHTLCFNSECCADDNISADKERIEQVVTNIIGNSIKYTPAGGKIDVRLSKEKDEYKIEVSDNGVGIAEKDLPRLFERFYRVDKARNSDVGGTGLGLSIAKEIVLAHHGDIEVKSKKDVGTTVIITLPKNTRVCDSDDIA